MCVYIYILIRVDEFPKHFFLVVMVRGHPLKKCDMDFFTLLLINVVCQFNTVATVLNFSHWREDSLNFEAQKYFGVPAHIII